MKKKIFSSAILIIVILANSIIPIIYADNNEFVGIPNTKVKVGEEAKVYLNLENIKEYTLSEIVITTDIYIEPTLDTANTNLTHDDITYDAQKKELTVTNISEEIKTLCVTYTIPQYIASGTKIKITVKTFGYKETDLEEQYSREYEIIVVGEKTKIPNNNEKEETDSNKKELGDKRKEF